MLRKIIYYRCHGFFISDFSENKQDANVLNIITIFIDKKDRTNNKFTINKTIVQISNVLTELSAD